MLFSILATHVPYVCSTNKILGKKNCLNLLFVCETIVFNFVTLSVTLNEPKEKGRNPCNLTK